MEHDLTVDLAVLAILGADNETKEDNTTPARDKAEGETGGGKCK